MPQITIALEDQQQRSLARQAAKNKRTLSEEVKVLLDTYYISEPELKILMLKSDQIQQTFLSMEHKLSSLIDKMDQFFLAVDNIKKGMKI
jgi:hypothetical protein